MEEKIKVATALYVKIKSITMHGLGKKKQSCHCEAYIMTKNVIRDTRLCRIRFIEAGK